MTALNTLLRLRAVERQTAARAVRVAQDALQEQEQRLGELHARIGAARAGVDTSDAPDLAAWSAWRTQSELQARREEARRSQRARDLHSAGERLRVAAVDERSLEVLLEQRSEQEALDERRHEMKAMDALALRRAG